MKTFLECGNELKDAIYSCAHTTALTQDVNVALKAAEACEKLSRALNYIDVLKEREEK